MWYDCEYTFEFVFVEPSSLCSDPTVCKLQIFYLKVLDSSMKWKNKIIEIIDFFRLNLGSVIQDSFTTD